AAVGRQVRQPREDPLDALTDRRMRLVPDFAARHPQSTPLLVILYRPRTESQFALASEAVEAKDRVELDRVRSHPGLAVVEIEERDARYPCSSAQAHMVSCYAHLAAPKRSRVLVAARRRRLGDHVI